MTLQYSTYSSNDNKTLVKSDYSNPIITIIIMKNCHYQIIIIMKNKSNGDSLIVTRYFPVLNKRYKYFRLIIMRDN